MVPTVEYFEIFRPPGTTLLVLVFMWFIFHRFAIFAFFVFLNSRLLGAVVLKYSRIYVVSPYVLVTTRSQ